MLVLHPRCLPERNVKALRIVSIPLLSFIFSQSVIQSQSQSWQWKRLTLDSKQLKEKRYLFDACGSGQLRSTQISSTQIGGQS